MRRPTYSHARIALAVYDRSQAHRDQMLYNACGRRSLEHWACAEKQAVERVHVAFWLDTRDRNRLETVRVMSVRDVRSFVITGRAKALGGRVAA